MTENKKIDQCIDNNPFISHFDVKKAKYGHMKEWPEPLSLPEMREEAKAAKLSFNNIIRRHHAAPPQQTANPHTENLVCDDLVQNNDTSSKISLVKVQNVRIGVDLN